MRIEEVGPATLINADCREAMRLLDENSIDAIVCDPPYGLGFMGKGWDHGVPGKEFWVEALRVAKPGAHLLAFGGTRTFHRLMAAIEDAGWEIRDTIMWVYGSGFPKSYNLHGEWEGWGTALKPAFEPVIVARKPLVGTVAANVQQHGTGAINIDGCRVATDDVYSYPNGAGGNTFTVAGGVDGSRTTPVESSPLGRWPANLIHDGGDDVLALFPDSNGSGGSLPQVKITGYGDGAVGTGKSEYFGGPRTPHDAGKGSAARFFYCAKTSRKDRNDGTYGLEQRAVGSLNMRSDAHAERTGNRPQARGNHHPTVKPTELMRYLCRLVTPPGGTVLDPFMGSGSTGKAALKEGFGFVGVDNDMEHGYFDIAVARVRSAILSE